MCARTLCVLMQIFRVRGCSIRTSFHIFIHACVRVRGCLSACVLLSMWASACVSECVHVCVFVFMCVSLIVSGMCGEGVCAYRYEENVHLCVWSCLCTCG